MRRVYQRVLESVKCKLSVHLPRILETGIEIAQKTFCSHDAKLRDAAVGPRERMPFEHLNSNLVP